MSRRAPRFVVAVAGATVAAACSLVIDTSGLADAGDADAMAHAADAFSSLDGGAPEASGTGDAATDAPGGPCRPDFELATDPQNCGRCGHDCLGGVCVAAACQATTFITGEAMAVGVATDGTELFWSTFDGFLRAKQLDGAGARRDIVKLASAAHIEVDADYVYTAVEGNKQIVRVRKTTGVVEILAVCTGQCLGVAVSGGNVFFTDRGGSASLRMVTADPTSNGTALTTGLNSPEDAFATATDVYVANEGSNDIIRVPRGGGASSIFLTVTDPVAFAIEGADLFIVSQVTGTIYRRGVAGGNLDAVATAQAQPAGLLVTPTAVYWATLGGGTIMRLAR